MPREEQRAGPAAVDGLEDPADQAHIVEQGEPEDPTTRLGRSEAGGDPGRIEPGELAVRDLARLWGGRRTRGVLEEGQRDRPEAAGSLQNAAASGPI